MFKTSIKSVSQTDTTFRSAMFLSLPKRIHTPTIILPIKPILSRQFYGSLIPIPLLKITVQISHSILSGQLLPNLIEFLCVFQRTNRKGRSKIIKFSGPCHLCRFQKSQVIAAETPLSTLRLSLQSLCRLIKPFLLIRPLQKGNPVLYRQPGDKCFLLFHPFFILLSRKYIRIIIKHRNGKILRKIFQHIAAAGSTAAMQ